MSGTDNQQTAFHLKKTRKAGPPEHSRGNVCESISTSVSLSQDEEQDDVKSEQGPDMDESTWIINTPSQNTRLPKRRSKHRPKKRGSKKRQTRRSKRSKSRRETKKKISRKKVTQRRKSKKSKPSLAKGPPESIDPKSCPPATDAGKNLGKGEKSDIK